MKHLINKIYSHLLFFRLKPNADIKPINLLRLWVMSGITAGSILGFIHGIKGSPLLYFNGIPSRFQLFYMNIIDHIIICIFMPFYPEYF